MVENFVKIKNAHCHKLIKGENPLSNYMYCKFMGTTVMPISSWPKKNISQVYENQPSSQKPKKPIDSIFASSDKHISLIDFLASIFNFFCCPYTGTIGHASS